MMKKNLMLLPLLCCSCILFTMEEAREGANATLRGYKRLKEKQEKGTLKTDNEGQQIIGAGGIYAKGVSKIVGEPKQEMPLDQEVAAYWYHKLTAKLARIGAIFNSLSGPLATLLAGGGGTLATLFAAWKWLKKSGQLTKLEGYAGNLQSKVLARGGTTNELESEMRGAGVEAEMRKHYDKNSDLLEAKVDNEKKKVDTENGEKKSAKKNTKKISSKT